VTELNRSKTPLQQFFKLVNQNMEGEIFTIYNK